MKYSRILTLITPIIVLVLLELFFLKPEMFYVSLVLANLFIVLTVKQFIKESSAGKKWWNFLILPLCFFTSLAVYSTLVTNKLIIQLLFFINIAFIYFYLRNIYYYLIRPDLYKSYVLENISSYGNFLAVFFLASSIYGFQSFLNISVWLLAIVMIIAMSLIIYNVMWANKIEFRKGLVYILVSCLILVEVAWSISFLPLKYNVAGLVLAICYYILVGLVRFYLKDDLVKRRVRLYLIFGLASIFLILLTSRWM